MIWKQIQPLQGRFTGVSVGSTWIETNSNVFHSVVRIKIHKERESALFRVTRVTQAVGGTNKEGDHYNFGGFLGFVRRRYVPLT